MLEGGHQVTALGLMSGTSLDGVDAAVLSADGEGVAGHGPVLAVPYTADQRGLLRAAVEAVRDGPGQVPGKPPEIVARAAALVTAAHAEIVNLILKINNLTTSDIDIIGFHGQTILHRPEAAATWQIGDGAELARRTGIPVVSDFRSADMAAGGEGAPLAPVYHRALAAGLDAGPPGPLAVLNLGGVANLTWIGPDARIVAFDSGPGNGLIDDWAGARAGLTMDRDGALAAAGTVDQACLERLLEHQYFSKPAPKSLDRNAFSLDAVAGLGLEDGAATLTEFTAKTVAAAVSHLPAPPGRWLVTGGGRRNPSLMAALSCALGVPVEPVETVGWRGDFLEAEAFAYLAVRHLRNLPGALPEVTGARRAAVLGRLDRPGP